MSEIDLMPDDYIVFSVAQQSAHTPKGLGVSLTSDGIGYSLAMSGKDARIGCYLTEESVLISREDVKILIKFLTEKMNLEEGENAIEER